MKKRLLLAGIVVLGLIGLILVPNAKKTDRIPKPGKPILTSYRGGHTLRPVEIDGQECYIFQSYDRKKTSDIVVRQIKWCFNQQINWSCYGINVR